MSHRPSPPCHRGIGAVVHHTPDESVGTPQSPGFYVETALGTCTGSRCPLWVAQFRHNAAIGAVAYLNSDTGAAPSGTPTGLGVCADNLRAEPWIDAVIERHNANARVTAAMMARANQPDPKPLTAVPDSCPACAADDEPLYRVEDDDGHATDMWSCHRCGRCFVVQTVADIAADADQAMPVRSVACRVAYEDASAFPLVVIVRVVSCPDADAVVGATFTVPGLAFEGERDATIDLVTMTLTLTART